MAKRRQCAGCGEYNAATARECKSCGNEFGQSKPEQAKGPALCAFDDHGAQCPCRGVISFGTLGESAWYCREHAEVMQGRKPDTIGNTLPPARKSIAVDAWRAAMARYRATMRERETYKSCPECYGRIPREAMQCACGWRERKTIEAEEATQ